MDLNWTPELEVALFHSLHGHKPVGEYIFSPVQYYLVKPSIVFDVRITLVIFLL